MELYGKIDEQRQFILDTEDGEAECLLFRTLEDSDEDPEEFDLEGFAPGAVTVTCESFDGEDAWGVSEVAANDPGDDADSEEAEEHAPDAGEAPEHGEAEAEDA